MPRVKILVVLSVVLLILTSCAPLGRPRMMELGRPCSDTPRNAIDILLRAIIEGSLPLLELVIPGGLMQAYRVAGGGSIERGREVVRGITDHPEVHRGNEVDNKYTIVDVSGDGNERLVLIEREVDVLFMEDRKANIRIEHETYRRTFNVTFDPVWFCILAVRPVDASWIRMDAPTSQR